MKTAYLAGAMEFAADGGVGWRQDITRWLAENLSHQALDPTYFEHDQLSDAERATIPGLKKSGDFDRIRELSHRIVLYDARLLINHTDYVICLWDRATQMGCGTAGEITLAAWTGKPVHLVLNYPAVEASTWMIGCTTTIHPDFDDLKRTLLSLYGARP